MALTQVSSGGIKDGSITNADLDSSAAIDGSKVSPDFGSQNIVTTGTASAGALIPSGSSIPTNGVYLPAANSVAISTNGTGRLFIDASGNTTVVDGALTSGNNGDVLFGRYSSLFPDPGVSYFKLSTNNTDGSNGGLSIFTLASDVLSERMRLDSSGRLGLGTSTTSTNYGRLIHIHNPDGQGASLHLTDTTSGATNSDGFELVSHNGTAYLVQRENADMVFMTNGTNERARIDSSGRLGLGTSTPSANLESQGNVSSTTLFSGFQGLRIQNANGSAFGVSADINFVAGTGSDNRGAAIGAIYDSATSGNHLYFATNGSSVSSNDTLTERLRITAAGNVGIGTTGPSEALHVIGNILASGNITAFSDATLKTNVEPVGNALDTVLALEGVTYDRIDQPDTGRQLGLIAQEVEKHVPEVVSTHENGIKSISYGSLVALLIEAIKEQQQTISALQAKVEGMS